MWLMHCGNKATTRKDQLNVQRITVGGEKTDTGGGRWEAQRAIRVAKFSIAYKRKNKNAQVSATTWSRTE